MTQRGGKRVGAGRKPSRVVEARKVIAASGNGQVLATVDENKIWRGVINCRDPRIKLDAMKYLTDRRDGKAAQSGRVVRCRMPAVGLNVHRVVCAYHLTWRTYATENTVVEIASTICRTG